MEILYTLQGEFRAVVFDATIRELHGRSAQAMEHPVERGAAITDHVRPERARLSVEVHVTNTPIISPNVDGAEGEVRALQLRGTQRRFQKGAKVNRQEEVTDAEWGDESADVAANVLQFSASFDRVQVVWDTLDQLRRDAVELTVITTLGQYDSMVIVDLSAPRDAGSRHAATFQMELVEIQYVESEVVDAPTPLETRAERRRRLGAQGTQEPEAQEDRSLAAALVEDYVGIGLIHQPQRSGRGIFTR